MNRRSQTSLTALLLLSACVLRPAAAPLAQVGVDTQQATWRWDVRDAEELALWFEARALAERDQQETLTEEQQALVEALRTFQTAGVGPQLAALDARVLAAGNVAGVEALFATLPETWRPSGSERASALRAPALELARRLVAALPAWLESGAQTARDATKEHWRALEESLAERGFAPCLQRAAKSLALPWPAELDIALVPVLHAPRPGAFTARTRSGSVSLIGTAGLTAPELLEVVLHEALHQLEAAAASAALGDAHAGLPGSLDRALEGAGLAARDRRRRTAVHALLFYAAGQSVRDCHAADHVDHGLRKGTYARLPAFHPGLQRLFARHMQGHLSQEQFLARATDLILESEDSP